MWIVEFTDYKNFLKTLIRTFPNSGRGQHLKLAKRLKISAMTLSHIMTRERNFTLEQAYVVAEHFGLDKMAREYFIYLVSYARSDSKEMNAFFEEKLQGIRDEVQNIKNLVASQGELSDNNKGIFYSNWYYCGIWLLISIEGYQTVDSISEYFGLSRSRVGEIIAFLMSTGLCVQSDGLIVPGKTAIHVNKKSEFVNNHRRNWREKARERFTEPDETDIFYSSPVSISNKDAEQFHKELLKLIESFSKRVEASPEQKLMCLNVDWFKF